MTPPRLAIEEDNSEADNSEADDELDNRDIITNRQIRLGSPSRTVNKRHSVDIPLTKSIPATGRKYSSLPRSKTTTILHNRTSSESEIKSQVRSPRKGKTKEEKKLKPSSIKKGSRSRPQELPLSHSRNNKSHDRHMTKGSNFLPAVMSSPQTTPPHSPHPPHISTDNKLPTLNNMQPVAMVAVDTDQDKLKVQNFGESAPLKPTNRLSVQRAGPFVRSNSMMPLK